jgi:flagellar basal-body rod modification protein FlgD
MLGKDDFLTMLVTQLQYQDPMSPMESGEMMQQMAMLGLMEQTTNMRTALDDLSKSMEMSKWQQASNMIGKEVDAINSYGEAVTGVVEEVVNYDGYMYLLTEDDTFQVGQIVSLREPSVESETGTDTGTDTEE